MTSRKFFTLFLLCALVPIIIAKISLSMGWFTAVNTNKGEWLTQEIQLLPSAPVTSAHWRLVYVQAPDCLQMCDQALHTLQQVYMSFGRKQRNIKPLVLAEKIPSGLENFPAINWQAEFTPAQELQNHIVIVNQRGLVLLRYPVVRDAEAAANTAKDIRADLLKLINYDRGGV